MTIKRFFSAVCLVSLLSSIVSAESNDNAIVSDSGGFSMNVRTDTDRRDFLMSVGNAYMQNKEMDESIKAYEKALKLDPENKQIRYILSFVYIEGKAYGKAEKLLLELTELYPDDFEVWNNIAWLYATATNPKYRNGDKAIKYAQEALTLAPYDHHVWSTLSEAYYINGEFEKAHRSILQMKALVEQKGKKLTQKMVDDYIKQLDKCQMAVDTQKELKKNK